MSNGTSCGNPCGTQCTKPCGSGFLVIIVLYILLAIILGSVIC